LGKITSLPVPPKGQPQETKQLTPRSFENGFVIEKLREDAKVPEYQQSDYVANWDYYKSRTNPTPNTLVYKTS